MHDVQIFGAGAYSFDPTLGGGAPETGAFGITVGANQLGAHLLMDWNYNLNIDIVMVWDKDSTFGPQMFTGDANPANNGLNRVWMLASIDGDGDGVSGIAMAANGPFTNGSLSGHDCAPALAKRDGTPSRPRALGHGALVVPPHPLRHAAAALRSSLALSGARQARPQWLDGAGRLRASARRRAPPADYSPPALRAFRGSQRMNFNLKGTLVPVPAPTAVWLLGSGLLGLLGVARRRMA